VISKKERSSRKKPDSVNKTWQKIDRNTELSTREKLEKLISLTKPGAKKKAEIRASRAGGARRHTDSR
jgi:hypothetical protein